MNLDIDKIRENYPILNTLINEKTLIYFDNASTMQMSNHVLNKINNHYKYNNANIHRGVYYLSQVSSDKYENAKKYIANFIGAKDEETIIMTSGVTESINLVVRMVEDNIIRAGDEILITEMEHHSNLIPWQQLCKRSGAILKYIPVMKNGNLNMDKFYEIFSKKTKIVSFTQLSNLTGIKTPMEEIISYARKHGDALILIDGAQGICNELINVDKLDCDFYCFSGHKIGALTGCGILYVKEKLVKNMNPVKYGGGMVYKTTMEDAYYLNSITRFEGGTPNYIGAISVKHAIKFMKQFNCEELFNYKNSLVNYMEEKLKQVEKVKILGETNCRKGTLAFIVEGIHSYDIAKMLDKYGISIRSGHNCAQPYLNALGYEHACRISPTFYNKYSEIDYFIDKLQNVIKIYEKVI